MSLIPGTNIKVDDFRTAGIHKNEFVFLLSHMHSDHLKGLTDTWDHGRIYTSEINKRLVIDKFPNLALCVTGFDLNEPRVIFIDPEQKDEHITITLFDSNHCFGSVMFLL